MEKIMESNNKINSVVHEYILYKLSTATKERDSLYIQSLNNDNYFPKFIKSSEFNVIHLII